MASSELAASAAAAAAVPFLFFRAAKAFLGFLGWCLLHQNYERSRQRRRQRCLAEGKLGNFQSSGKCFGAVWPTGMGYGMIGWCNPCMWFNIWHVFEILACFVVNVVWCRVIFLHLVINEMFYIARHSYFNESLWNKLMGCIVSDYELISLKIWYACFQVDKFANIPKPLKTIYIFRIP